MKSDGEGTYRDRFFKDSSKLSDEYETHNGSLQVSCSAGKWYSFRNTKSQI